ncbi:MAG: hypothetical protein ABI835_13115 [Chloroflexota bacterium]
MTLEALAQEIRALPVEQRKQLVMVILDSLTENAVPAPIQPKLKDYRDYVQSVDDQNCTGERIAWVIAMLMFSKERNELTYFLEHGGKFPVFHDYIPKIWGIVQVLGNTEYGQHFDVEID